MQARCVPLMSQRQTLVSLGVSGSGNNDRKSNLPQSPQLCGFGGGAEPPEGVTEKRASVCERTFVSCGRPNLRGAGGQGCYFCAISFVDFPNEFLLHRGQVGWMGGWAGCDARAYD